MQDISDEELEETLAMEFEADPIAGYELQEFIESSGGVVSAPESVTCRECLSMFAFAPDDSEE
jgi:hypothetical protein